VCRFLDTGIEEQAKRSFGRGSEKRQRHEIASSPPGLKHPGTPLLYDQSNTIAEGGLPFRARWDVAHTPLRVPITRLGTPGKDSVRCAPGRAVIAAERIQQSIIGGGAKMGPNALSHARSVAMAEFKAVWDALKNNRAGKGAVEEWAICWAIVGRSPPNRSLVYTKGSSYERPADRHIHCRDFHGCRASLHRPLRRIR
jgi:hypothetical protein